MPLKISLRQASSVTIVDLEGRLVIGPEANALKDKFDQIDRKGTENILVNLSNVTQLDSSGICSLLHGYNLMKQKGGTLKLLHPGGHAREVLEVMRLIEVIPTLDDEALAVASFHAGGAVAS